MVVPCFIIARHPPTQLNSHMKARAPIFAAREHSPVVNYSRTITNKTGRGSVAVIDPAKEQKAICLGTTPNISVL